MRRSGLAGADLELSEGSPGGVWRGAEGSGAQTGKQASVGRVWKGQPELGLSSTDCGKPLKSPTWLVLPKEMVGSVQQARRNSPQPGVKSPGRRRPGGKRLACRASALSVVLHTPFFSLSNISSRCAATAASITLEAAGEKPPACVHPSQVHDPPACLTESVACRF